MRSPNTVKTAEGSIELLPSLSHEEAKELYRNTKDFSSKKQITLRDFIFYRWQLGNYFSAQKQEINDWVLWINHYWPEIDSKSANLWIQLSDKLTLTDITVASIDRLKRIYMTLLSINPRSERKYY